MSKTADPSRLLHRYELKYLIHKSLIKPITDFVSLYCILDRYSLESDNHYYIVNSLYFDSPSLEFLRRRIEGCDNRFNMRVRYYGAKPEQRYFLEVKQKCGGIVKKIRGELQQQLWPDFVKKRTSEPINKTDNKNDKNLSTFLELATIYNVEPRIFIKYQRQAWISHCDDYARITFDIDIKCKSKNDYNLNSSDWEFANCDNPAYMPDGANVVLELKCYSEYVPLWMIDLIKKFELQKISFSKYLVGMKEIKYRVGPHVITS